MAFWHFLFGKRRLPQPPTPQQVGEIVAYGSKIELIAHEGQPLFAVICGESHTQRPDQLTGQGQLDLALRAIPGASARRSEPQTYDIGGLCTFTTYHLAISEPNALTLSASSYSWSEEAREAAEQYAIDDKAILGVKKLMLAQFSAEERQLLGELQKAQQEGPSGWEQFMSDRIKAVKQQLGLTEPPVPARWSTIELVIHEGETLFAVTCPVCETVVPTTAKELLDTALTMSPGASAVQSEPQPYRIEPGGIGDGGELITYYLTLRPANVLALLAAGFPWSEEAREAAQRYTFGDEPIRVKKRLLEQYAASQRDCFGEGQPLPGVFTRFLSRWTDAVRQQLGLTEPPV